MDDKLENGKYYHRFWTIPTGFTLLRILSSIGIVSYISLLGVAPGSIGLALWTVLTAASDGIDGLLARGLHQVSKWGQALDPIADKVLNWGIGVAMMATGAMPLWPLAIGVRDLVVGALTVKRKMDDGKKKQQAKETIAVSKKQNKWQKYYEQFRLGDNTPPTYPAKFKMFFQSIGVISTMVFGFGSVGLSLLAPLAMTSAILTVPFEIYAIRKKYYKKETLTKPLEDSVTPLIIEPEKESEEKQSVKELTSPSFTNQKVDYTQIDRYIEQQMIMEAQQAEQLDEMTLNVGFQKKKK